MTQTPDQPDQPPVTGLDLHAAYRTMYPGLQGVVRLQDVQDSVLKVVGRAARVRADERERCLAPFRALAERLSVQGAAPLQAADLIQEALKEIR